jgi:diguanylate cyclase (GGDEF)-like protein
MGAASGGVEPGGVLVRNRSGAVRTSQVEAADGERVAMLAEIGALRARVTELEALADTDTLTPLANRRAFLRRVDYAIRQTVRHGIPAAVAFIDLDGLKPLNDAHGHAAGDAMLCHIALRLAEGVRATDMVARISGDEFAVLLDHATEADAARRMAAIADGLAAEPLRHADAALPVRLSWGVAAIRGDDSVDGVIARADAAMYAAKAAQRSDK